MKFLRVSGLVVSLLSLSMAAMVPITVNVDATITISNGSNSEVVSLLAATPQDVSLSWATESTPLSIEGVPVNSRYYDTTFATTLADNPKLWSAWDASKVYYTGDMVSHNGKNWSAGWETLAGAEPGTTGKWGVWSEVPSDASYELVINFTNKPLPQDTAFVPIIVNVDGRLTATPTSINVEVPAGGFTFDLIGKSKDTIYLPVVSDNTPISTTTPNISNQLKMNYISGKHHISLPHAYMNGKLKVFSVNGQQITSMDLSAQSQNDISVWNVGTGIYLMQVIAPNGISSTEKISHNGGDLRISTAYGNTFSTGGVLNHQRVSTVTSRAVPTASYQFTIQPTASRFVDSTFTVELSGQMNEVTNIYFVDPDGNNFDMLVDSATYEELFPNRFGLGYGAYINDPLPDNPSKITKLSSDGDYDFYTYNSLVNAIDSIGVIEVDLYQVQGHNYMHRIVWRNKKTGATRTMVNNVEYESYKSQGTEVKVATVDYANFCNEGDIATKKQELAAFFGNISHETTGGGNEEKSKTWGLYWREEAAWQKGSTGLGYVDQYPNALYPASPAQSYHGRGPIQITHNVNYGQLSEFFYGDKQVLLDDPGKLVPNSPEDATVAFMSAIWFWMTPQSPKPSCHDVMVGNWIPNDADKAANRDKSRFGMTVNIINGGLECGRATDHRVHDRIDFYKRYIKILGETPESDCECSQMGYY